MTILQCALKARCHTYQYYTASDCQTTSGHNSRRSAWNIGMHHSTLFLGKNYTHSTRSGYTAGRRKEAREIDQICYKLNSFFSACVIS